MKKLIFICILVNLINHSSGQDYASFAKFCKLASAFGIPNNLDKDTIIIRTYTCTANVRLAEQMTCFLAAAECYARHDYENSFFYIHKVSSNFRDRDLKALKYFLVMVNYANAKNIGKTAAYYYIIDGHQILPPESWNLVKADIARNFKRADFDEALSRYYYYHKRQAILDDIKFVE
jgi:hypothetical protein